MPSQAGFVELDFQKIKHRTDAAILFVIDGKDVWIPLSVIDEDGVDEESGGVTVLYSFAYEKELI